MFKDMLKDLLRDLLKFFAGLAVPVSMVFIGAALIGISIEFKIMMLLWVGGVVALCGILWGLFLVLWHSGA